MRSTIQTAIDALATQRRIPADLGATAGEINAHHAAARKKADEAIRKADAAVHHAREAGRLLLDVKAVLPHGQFIAWCRENLKVSARQAQRYMAASQGKPPPLKTLASTSDTMGTAMSHLQAPTPAEPPEHLAGEFKPDWQPTAGHWYFTVTDSHGVVWVVPDANDTGLFHVSRLYEEGGESLYDGTSRPIEAWLVEDYLRLQYGIEDPWLLPWKSRLKSGLARPFGEPGHA
jgi:hypothetical protein